MAQGLVKIINRIWEQREQIEPDYEMHQRPGSLEFYKLLLRTNCRDLGWPTALSRHKLTVPHALGLAVRRN